MTDAAIVWTNISGDIAMDGYDLKSDNGLQTAVIISLFTDRRANDDDALPAGDDRRGWWADAFLDVEDDRIGSRLWLLNREKQMQRVVIRAREYAEEALQWLVDDGVAKRVTVETEVVRDGVLGLLAKIDRPDGTAIDFQFDHIWEAI